MTVHEALARLSEFEKDERAWQARMAGHEEVAKSIARG
jgi:hypothetical protein